MKIQAKKQSSKHRYFGIAGSLVGMTLLLIVGFMFIGRPDKAAATCSPSTNYGTDTITLDIPSTGTYYTWLRMESPDGVNDEIMMNVDGGTCYTMGETMAADTWTWVDTPDGSSTPVSLSLSAGDHSIVFTGNEQGVGLDEIQFLESSSCTPNGVTNNCTTNQEPPPTTSITSPSNDATEHSAVTVDSTDTDNSGSGLASVSLYINGTTLVQTITTSPFNFSLNTLNYTDGTYPLATVAIDNDNDMTTSSTVSITVTNGDLNSDGNVNISDLAIMAAHWGNTDSNYADGNITGQSTINISDLAVLAANWGYSTS